MNQIITQKQQGHSFSEKNHADLTAEAVRQWVEICLMQIEHKKRTASNKKMRKEKDAKRQ